MKLSRDWIVVLMIVVGAARAMGQVLHLQAVDQESGDPLANAAVYVDIAEMPDVNLKTDGHGVVDVLYAPTAAYLGVRVTAEHHVPMMMYWRGPGNVPKEYSMNVPVGTRIGGEVVDDEGKPIAGATVRIDLFNIRTSMDLQFGVSDHIVTSGADGKWSYDGAPAQMNIARVGVSHPDYVGESADTFTKENFAGNTAALLDGSAKLVLHKGVRTSGVVRDSAGKPIAGARIGLGRDRRRAGMFPNIFTDDGGRFAFGARPGEEVIVTVRAHAYSPELRTIKAGEAPGEMTFDLKPGHPLRGRVVDDAGNGVAQAWFVAATWRGMNTIHTEVRADADGRFVWDSAPEDEVICDIERPGYMTRSNVPVTAKGEEQTFVLPKTGPIIRKRPDATAG